MVVVFPAPLTPRRENNSPLFISKFRLSTATIFLYFLDRNSLLYKDNNKILSDSALVAITILIAESKPEEKEIIIDLIMNFLTM